MKNYNRILEKLQKYWYYHQLKSININIFISVEILPSNPSQIKERQIYIFFFRKTVEKQMKNQVDAFRSFFDKIGKLRKLN